MEDRGSGALLLLLFQGLETPSLLPALCGQLFSGLHA